jgi:protocatechuate 3,4-dioxygenase beta subunit
MLPGLVLPILLAATASVPAQPVRISGRILEHRQPLAGARVELYPAAPLPADGPLKSTQTDKDGAFELLAPESGAWRVVVRAKDLLAMEHLVVPLVDDVSLPPIDLVRPATLTVQALGPDGRPLAGLGIRATRSQDNFPWNQIGWQPAEARGVTGADGRLILPRRELVPVDVHILDPLYLAEAASAVNGDSVTIRPRRRPRTVEVREPRRAEVTGKVTDAVTGKPIAGALVWSGLPPDLPPAHTAGDGSFRLPVLAAGKTFGVAASGYEMSEPQPASPGRPAAVVLKRTVEIRGQVVDTAGAPVAGAEIQVSPGRARENGLSSLWYLSQLSSRGDGSFSVRDLLPGGVYRLAAHRDGYGRSEVAVKAGAAGQPTPARIVLGAGATVAGRIVDEGGNPVEGAEVLMMHAEVPDPASFVRTLSDAAGAFSIPHRLPGSFRLFARHAGYALGASAPIVVPEGDARVDAGEIVLKGGSAIEGRVTDTRGRAVEGAEVRVWPEHGPLDPALMLAEEEPPPNALTGPDGLFRIEDLERGRRYSLTVQHPAHPREAVPEVEAPTADPVLIELQPARALFIRVVGPEGEPVPDAAVLAQLTAGFQFRTGMPLGRTDSAGELRAGDLKPGLLDLEVNARGYRQITWKGVQVPRDRDPDPVTVTMERGAVLEIRVHDGEGNPLSGVRVLVMPKNPAEPRPFRHPFNRPTTGEDGLVRFDDLSPGEYRVSGMGSGRSAEASVRLGTGTARVDLVFERGAAIAGRVVDEEGEPVPFVAVHAELHDETGIHGRGESTQADGSFVIRDLADGEYSVTASARGYATSEPQRLRLGGSDVEGLEIRLAREADSAIGGRVLGLSPDALSRVSIEAHASASWESATGPVDREGRYRLAGLRAGRWKVTARQLNGRAIQEETVVEPGAEAVLDIRFPEGLTFSGRVTLDGRPLRGAEIAATPLKSEGTFARARADFEGRFTLGPLQPGPHSLRVHGADSALGTYRTVDLQEGQEIRLEIETGGLQGRVLSPAGEPVPDAVVQIRIVDPGDSRSFAGPALRTDAQGAFEILSIPTGPYTLVVQEPGLPETQVRVEVQPGAVQDVVIQPRGN